ncbi:MAG: hypothetical protein JSV96_00630 [Candidatus Aminicenantes bacterium]|nr:MAG: hypothetical protein JSV96_00630 [Candidatus Aminicenantes bacterium]
MEIIKKAALILFLLFSSFSLSSGIDISLRLSGGLCYLKLNDINRAIKGWEESWKKTTISREGWEFAGGEAAKFNIGYDFDGEIMVSISPHLAASFGVGLIYGELIDKKTELFVNVDSRHYAFARPAKVTALPLIFSGYFFFPLSKKLDIFIKGGLGLIWAKYVVREGYLQFSEYNPEDEFDYYWHQSASAQGSAFVGSLGINYSINPGLGFFIEGGARWAKISGFRGEAPEGGEGDLYSFEEYDPDIDFWRKNIVIFTEKPTGDNFRSVQKAVVDFTGFSAKIGLLIKF